MRIISGKYGSRKLKTLMGNNTRPTEDRVREAVFGRTGPYFNGGIILDLFAGSGAVSLEAISRGFDFAYMCDISKEAIKVIYENIDALGVRGQTKVFNSNYRSVLTKLTGQNVRFDMIYLDPPFHHGTEREALKIICENDLLKDDGIIIVETDKKDSVECESPYYVEKSAVYGINKVSYIRKESKMQRAIYPGSFDPITYGHLDIIRRASEVFDEVIVLIMNNDEKKGTFDMQERLDMVENVIQDFDNVSVMAGEGLTVEMARKLGANILIRGIRAVTDYEYEMQLATANMILADEVHTVFLVAKPEYSFLSSSTAKSIAKCHGDIRAFVPEYVEEKLKEKYRG